MGSSAESLIAFDPKIIYKKETQKYLIEFILFKSEYDLKSLADILEIPTFSLAEVLSGQSVLENKIAHKLWEWFLVLIN